MKNVITLGKLISPLLFCLPLFLSFNIYTKNTRNEFARLVMGTIFLVNIYIYIYIYIYICLANRKCSRNAPGVRTSHHSNAHEQ